MVGPTEGVTGLKSIGRFVGVTSDTRDGATVVVVVPETGETMHIEIHWQHWCI